MRAKIYVLTALCITLLCFGAVGISSAAEPQTYKNSIGMELVLIPAGSFSVMIFWDSIVNEKLYGPKAIVSKPFYLGKYEVTQEQWVAVMVTGNNPAQFKGRTNPVEMVSWYDVQEFIRRLNQMEGHDRYRLPTEMEWEYAARGGTDTLFFFMKDPKTWEEANKPLADHAWFNGNSDGTTHSVGQKKPNQYGLYDIYGNVLEWVQDYWSSLPKEREIRDYRGPNDGSYRVCRGGSWRYTAENCSSDARYDYGPFFQANDMGFRLALSPE